MNIGSLESLEERIRGYQDRFAAELLAVVAVANDENADLATVRQALDRGGELDYDMEYAFETLRSAITGHMARNWRNSAAMDMTTSLRRTVNQAFVPYIRQLNEAIRVLGNREHRMHIAEIERNRR